MRRLDQQILYRPPLQKKDFNCFSTGFKLKEVQVDKLIVRQTGYLFWM